ncbi:MAG: heparinase II/III family protein, partial [Planctomycetota bacterium]
ATGTRLNEDTSLRWHRLRTGYHSASAPAKQELDLPTAPSCPRAFCESRYGGWGLPQARLFRDIGVAAMHTKLAQTPNNLMLAFRSSPYGSFNHAHADQNSFNILFGGERLFCNSGYYIAYADEHFQGWYKHSRGHNTVLIDDKGQVLGRTEAYGWLCRYLHGQQVTYCLGDASNAYSGTGLTRFRRHILFLRPSIVIIYDELEADHPAKWSWLLHSPNEISAEAANNRLLAPASSWRRQERGETARVQVDLYGSVPLSFEVNNRFDPPALNWRGRKTADGKLFEYPNQWHATVASMTKTANMRYLAVIQIHNAVDGKAFDAPRALDNGCIRVGSWELCAELDPFVPPGLEVRSVNGKIALAVNKHSINVGGKRYGSGNPNRTILVEMSPDKNIVAESTEMYP